VLAMPERFTYTAAELAGLLGVGVSSVYQSVTDGTCPVEPIRVGRRMVWAKASVDSLLGLSEDG
jgi:predicted DNA-binding transcriptional regulator AlpA